MIITGKLTLDTIDGLVTATGDGASILLQAGEDARWEAPSSAFGEISRREAREATGSLRFESPRMTLLLEGDGGQIRLALINDFGQASLLMPAQMAAREAAAILSWF